MKIRYFIRLTLYNYELSSRYDMQEIECPSEEEGKKKLEEILDTMRFITTPEIMSASGRWCSKNGFRDSWIYSVDGLYKSTTELLVKAEIYAD